MVCLCFGVIEVCDVMVNNLRNVDVDILIGVFMVVMGVVGLGKSLLIYGFVLKCEGVVVID